MIIQNLCNQTIFKPKSTYFFQKQYLKTLFTSSEFVFNHHRWPPKFNTQSVCSTGIISAEKFTIFSLLWAPFKWSEEYIIWESAGKKRIPKPQNVKATQRCGVGGHSQGMMNYFPLPPRSRSSCGVKICGVRNGKAFPGGLFLVKAEKERANRKIYNRHHQPV